MKVKLLLYMGTCVVVAAKLHAFLTLELHSVVSFTLRPVYPLNTRNSVLNFPDLVLRS
jgi:hypothetical protein